MALDDRDEGFYWIFINDEWTVAQWANGEWWVTGMSDSYPTEYITEIGERLVPPPGDTIDHD